VRIRPRGTPWHGPAKLSPMGRWLSVALLIGCGESAGGGPDAFTPTLEAMSVTLWLTGVSREDVDGRMRGVDLDGRVSDATDELGCFQEDWIDPVGAEAGVDNNYYSLVVTNEGIGDPDAPSVDDLIRDAGITLPMRVSGAPGGVEVRLGDTEPQVAPLREGHFQALTDATLVFEFPELSSAVLYDLAVDAVMADGQLLDIVIAGALDIAEIVATVEAESPDVDPALVRTTLEGVADLDPGEDGRCTRVSAAFTATAEP